MANNKTEAIEHISRLRRAEDMVDADARAEIARAREYLERTVGSTVRPAEAARLLGVSQPALHRWLDKGEISTVLTPQGRREIPLSELLGLLEEVAAARKLGASRPLARVIAERRRRTAEIVDLDRLLPPRRRRGHRTAELQGLAYHRLVAERLDERLIEDAQRRLERWRRTGRIHLRWADEWEQILTMPAWRIAKTIGADTASARTLRQTSPFAGALPELERRRLVRGVEERASR